jgi:MFS transporter, ACS family, solute carrier family 17 (sodium-dependent inorganic phosphate cotransporter), other
MNPKYASALLGITNTAGALPGILGVSAVGLLLDRTSSWTTALFLPIAACYAFGLVIFSVFGSSERREFN